MSSLHLHTLLWPLFLFFHRLRFVSSAIQQVPHNDARIQYIPRVCDLDCTRVCAREWWLSCLSDGGSSHRTKGNGTSANFSFRGTSVTWYTRTAPDGGKATVYIDSADPTPIDTNSPVTIEANPVYTRSGLDGTKTHMISIVYDVIAFTEAYERFVDVHHFEYDDSSGSGSGGGNQAPTSSATTTSRASIDQSRASSTAASSGSPTTDTRNTTLPQSQTQSGNVAQNTSLNALYPSLPSLGDTVAPTASSEMANSAGVGNQTRSSLHLSPSAIIGVAFGASGFLLLTAILLWCVKLRRKGPINKIEPMGSSEMHEISDIGHGHGSSESHQSHILSPHFQVSDQHGHTDPSASDSRSELLSRGSNTGVYASSPQRVADLKHRFNNGEDEGDVGFNGLGYVSTERGSRSRRGRTPNRRTLARTTSIDRTETGTRMSPEIDDLSPITPREIEEVRRMRAARLTVGYSTTRAETPPPRYVL